MTEEQQELAALHALGALAPEEARAFEAGMSADAELRREFEELVQTAGDFGRLAPAIDPPEHIKDQVMQDIARLEVQEREVNSSDHGSNGDDTASGTGSGGWSILAWALTAVFAASGAWLWSERTRLQDNAQALATREEQAREHLLNSEKQAAQLQTEVDRSRLEIDHLNNEVALWKEKTALAKMEIATLQSTVDDFRQGVAVIIWDAEKQQGVLKLEKMPPAAEHTDYQLWVVDPKKKDPVDAGVVRLDKNGFAKIEFKPADPISEAAKFALSIEREGGVPKGEGPIVLMGP